MDKNNNIEDIYKKSFEDFEVAPSPEIWTRIEQSLDPKPPLHQYKWAIFSLAGVIVLLSAYFILKPNTTKLPQETASHSDRNQPIEQPHTTVIVTDSIDTNEESFLEEENLPLTMELKSNSFSNPSEEDKVDIQNNIAQNNVETGTELFIEKKSTGDTEVLIAAFNPSDIIPTNITKLGNTVIAEESERTTNTPEKTPAQITNDDNDILMPNAFSLGSIDYSELKPSITCETCHSFEVVIYSKSGEVVFRTKDVNTGWNGTFKGNKVKADTYIYVISYKKENDNKVKKGYILVVP